MRINLWPRQPPLLYPSEAPGSLETRCRPGKSEKKRLLRLLAVDGHWMNKGKPLEITEAALTRFHIIGPFDVTIS